MNDLFIPCHEGNSEFRSRPRGICGARAIYLYGGLPLCRECRRYYTAEDINFLRIDLPFDLLHHDALAFVSAFTGGVEWGKHGAPRPEADAT